MAKYLISIMASGNYYQNSLFCRKCKNFTAYKIPDDHGWDGSCLNCGSISQSDVLKYEPLEIISDETLCDIKIRFCNKFSVNDWQIFVSIL